MKNLFALALITISTMTQAQSDYFREITDTPDEITSENILKRMIDGLGFRYYWASHSLNSNDLQYSPSEGARSSFETLEHIYGLSGVIKASVMGEISKRNDATITSYEELRAETLRSLEEASRKLEEQKVQNIKMRFSNGSSYPIWNLINGPIADAIYHTGQIVVFRRASGNPISPNISVLKGTAGD